MNSSIQQITSSDNPQFKRLKKLVTSARERRKQQKTIVDGVHLLSVIAERNIQPEYVVVSSDAEADVEITTSLQQFSQIKRIGLDKRLFDQLSPVETPSGILALIDIPKHQNSQIESAVVLENIQDPGNLGTILRTAAASGISRVYLSKGCAEAWSPKALRSGMGAQFVIDILEQCNLVNEVEKYEKVVATSLEAADTFYELDLSGSVAFVFGNEGAGVSRELLAKATDKVKIPMPGDVESLNVSAAAAICLFERVRQIRCTR